MYARIRLREWEAQKEFALFALKYANKFANYFWLFGKITLGFAWAILIGPRMVRHVGPGKQPQESYDLINNTVADYGDKMS